MFKKIVLIATASLIALAFSGCSKKPRRPNPLDTVMGPGSYRSGTGADDGFNPVITDGEDLQSRSFAGFEGANLEQLVANADRSMFTPIYFQFDSSSIAPQERSKLDAVADYLRDNSGAAIVLEGHCDWRGTQEYNLALGDRRAKSVENYLSTLGISVSRMQTLSQGDLKASEGASSAQMAKERKVELLIIR